MECTRRWSTKAVYTAHTEGGVICQYGWQELTGSDLLQAQRQDRQLTLTLYSMTGSRAIVHKVTCLTDDVLAMHDCIAVPSASEEAVIVRFWSVSFVTAFELFCAESCLDSNNG